MRKTIINLSIVKSVLKDIRKPDNYDKVNLLLSAERTVGLLWLNSAETWVDVDKSEDNKGVLATLFNYFNSDEKVPEVFEFLYRFETLPYYGSRKN